MSKRRAQSGPSRTEAGGQREAVGPGLEPSEQQVLGNAELQSRIDDPHPGDLLSEVARPRVSHAQLAIQLDAADPARLARLQELLGRSRLADREDLATALRASHAMRTTVDAALEAHFGGSDEETRWAVDAVLEAVMGALDGGALVDGAWEGGGARVELPAAALDGPLGDRADALVEVLARAHAPPEAAARSEDVGASVRAVCRSLALAVLLDEEEEEDEGWFDPTAELE